MSNKVSANPPTSGAFVAFTGAVDGVAEGATLGAVLGVEGVVGQGVVGAGGIGVVRGGGNGVVEAGSVGAVVGNVHALAPALLMINKYVHMKMRVLKT